MFRIMCHDIMSAILIIQLAWRNALLLYQVCIVLWEKEEFLYKSASMLDRRFRFVYPPVSPQQSYERGIWQMRTLRNREVKPHDKRCTVTEYWSWDSNPSLTPALLPSLLPLCLPPSGGNGAAPQESMCVHAWDMGQVREGGVAIWLVLPHFTNALFPDRPSAQIYYY